MIKSLQLLVKVSVAILILNLIALRFSESYGGPLSAVAIMLYISIHLKELNKSWKSYGLKKPEKPVRLLWQVPAVLIGTIFIGVLGGYFIGIFLSEAPDQVRFENIEGNFFIFLGWVAIGWIVGAFIEEMVFRGFFLNEFQTVLGKTRYSRSLAVILQAILFGLIHFYNRGLSGALEIFIVALSLGTFYILFNRNLWPTILAHGIVNTLSFLEDYLGA